MSKTFNEFFCPFLCKKQFGLIRNMLCLQYILFDFVDFSKSANKDKKAHHVILENYNNISYHSSLISLELDPPSLPAAFSIILGRC